MHREIRDIVTDIFRSPKWGMLEAFPMVRILIMCMAAVLMLFYVVVAFWAMTELLSSLARGAAVDDGLAIRNTGLLFVAMAGAPFLVWRTYSASAQAQTAEQVQITERFTKAVEQLSALRRLPEIREESGKTVQRDVEAPSIDTRIGALYALERISKDSKRDHIVVMETICAYVRGHSDRDLPEPSNPNLLYPFSTGANDSGSRPYRPRPDVYAAILVLGRRKEDRIRHEIDKRFRLNLAGTRLRQMDMQNAKLMYAYFASTDFTDTNLKGADLTQAWLHNAKFDSTVMEDCTLSGAALPLADLRNVEDLDPDKVKYAYGVLEGDFATLLPNNLDDATKDWINKNWLKPSSPNLSWREFWKEFDKSYAEYCKKIGLYFDI